MDRLRLRRLLDSVVAIAALLVMPYIIWNLLKLETARNLNFDIDHPETIAVIETTPPELLFAKAHWQLEEDNPLEAIRLYGAIQSKGDDAFRMRVHYNLGTLYLREAFKLWKTFGLNEYIRINTLLEAAKDNLRVALQMDPDLEAARYNLDLAYRITPPPRERDKNNFQGNKSSVFSTLPSLPGGGP